MLKLLRAICNTDLLEAVEGDLIYLYNEQLQSKGRLKANLLFLFNAIQFLQPFAIKRPKIMIITSAHINHFKSILRNLLIHKGFTAINLLGMSLAFAFSMAIFAFVSHELSYDRNQSNHQNIFRLTMRIQNNSGYDISWARTDIDWVNEIPDYFPEVESMVRFQSFRPRRVIVNEQKFIEEYAFAVENEVFKMFDFEFLQGGRASLDKPQTVVLTETTAQKYFGGANPMGQTIELFNESIRELTEHVVTGVIKDQPSNTHLPITLLSSNTKPEDRVGWAYVYMLLNTKDGETLTNKLPEFVSEKNEVEGLDITLGLQPISSIHLNSDLSREIKANGSKAQVYLFIVVAIFLLSISTINFANLNTTKSLSKTKEIGVRKVLGVGNSQLFSYFLIESLIISTLSALFGILLFFLMKSRLDTIIGFTLPIDLNKLLTALFLLVIIISVLASIYPSIMALRFSIIKTKLGAERGRSNVFNFRNFLLGFQFLVAIIITAGTLLLQKQFSFITNQDLGYQQAQLMSINEVPNEVKASYETFKSILKGTGGIEDVSAVLELPSNAIKDEGTITIAGQDDVGFTADLQVLDMNALELLGIDLVAGTGFPEGIDAHSKLPDPKEDFQAFLNSRRRAYLINESAMRAMGWSNPEDAINQQITWIIGELSLGQAPISGVVADYHQESMHNKIDPVVFTYEPVWFNNILIRTNTDNYPELISRIESSWNELFPDLPIDLAFADQDVAKLYEAERAQRTLMIVFSFIAILITLLGLYSMISYTLERRLKEMAIRKVLGAELRSIFSLLGKQYILLVFVSLLLSVPIVIFFGQNWLESYAYRISINGSSIVISLMFLLLIIAFTLIYQIRKINKRNPVEILKIE